jgi:hypothetical protein
MDAVFTFALIFAWTFTGGGCLLVGLYGLAGGFTGAP